MSKPTHVERRFLVVEWESEQDSSYELQENILRTIIENPLNQPRYKVVTMEKVMKA